MVQRERIKVLIVDDSELIRRLLTRILDEDPMLKVVGAAKDAFEAKDMVKQLSPDVITLDIEMPQVDGLRFLQVLMKANPIPVVMISTLTEAHATATLKALEYGAVDYMPKPKMYDSGTLGDYGPQIVKKVRMAARSNIASIRVPARPVKAVFSKQAANRVLAIGASTGGTEAIKHLLQQLPSQHFGVIISQHMPAGFTKTYAERLNRQTGFQVIEAKGGEQVQPGIAYLAPGDFHLTLRRDGQALYTQLTSTAKVSGHRPSVDVMFESVAKVVGKTAIAVILTGMGKDGATGMKQVKDQGGYTVAQDEQSCVVFGMPREAIRLEAVCSVQSLEDIGNHLVSVV